MKKILIILSVLMTTLTAFAQQPEEFAGRYESRFEMSNGEVIAFTLDLDDDGTFFFSSLKDLNTDEEKQELYAQGSWSTDEKNQLQLTTSESDLDEVHTLDLSGTKAEVIATPSNDNIKQHSTHLIIYDSKTPWLKGKRLERH